MRVHELAKELTLTSKELLAKLHDLGLEAKSHMSNLDDASLALAMDKLGGGDKSEPAEALAQEEAPKESTPPAEVKKSEPATPAPPAPVEAEPAKTGDKVIRTRGAIVVKEFAGIINLRPNQLIAELMKHNVLASINERIDPKIAQKIAENHGFVLEHEKKVEEHRQVLMKKGMMEEKEEEDRPEDMVPRAPIVTFLGHVDHGKTSLLDKIRDTTVAQGESGGITQHIGAYTVEAGGQKITFLDTPGHEAFTAMRARGANLTDIAVIIIAADDGIMPQTEEAIKHAKASGVTIMIAINKIDLPGANPDKVRQQLQAIDLAPEDWGGDIVCAEVSAITGKGVKELLELILLQAEMLELTASPARRGQGYVVEAQLEPGMGPTTNLLVMSGTLRVGDVILCDQYWGRVRALINDHGVKVKSVGPATPVKCLGLTGVPEVGVEFKICTNDKVARSLAEERAMAAKAEQTTVPKRASLYDLFDKIKEAEKLELKLVIKADVRGSIEALQHALGQIKSEKISINMILTGTGNVTVNDVLLSSASNAVILGFNVSKEGGVTAAAKREGVEIRMHTIIYELVDEVSAAMLGLLEPEIKEVITGHAEVRQVYSLGKTEKIAGCLIIDGRVTSKAKARVQRAGAMIHNGSLSSLRHYKDDVREMKESQECGISLERFNDFEEGDIIEAYILEELAKAL